MLLLVSLLVGCSGDDGEGPALSREAALGDLIFHDASLSASGTMSCATCHDPAHAHAPANDLAVQLGGADGAQGGLRAVPSLRYLFAAGAFRFDDEGTPVGGLFRDGRAASLAEQAGEPLFNPHEMANAGVTDLVDKLARAPYATEFEAVFGRGIFASPQQAFDKLRLALERYQLEGEEFRPFDSKFDAVAAGRAGYTTAEARGLEIFNDPARGNCAACHTSTPAADGTPALFTDFSYDNLGVPRNAAIAANGDPAHFDLGLCARTELRERADLCGAFKVPTLRNVATRKVFFHNGAVKSLEDALRFYVSRDTGPDRWYPDAGAGKFDDLPAEHHGNVNTGEVPYDRRRGDAPALNEDEIADLAAFLRTLDDGWTP